MADRKITWSPRAKLRLFDIYSFFNNRNKNKIYSLKLSKIFKAHVIRLKKLPEIGVETNRENVRGLTVGDYIIYYKVEPYEIIILTVWDSRQNPEDLKIY